MKLTDFIKTKIITPFKDYYDLKGRVGITKKETLDGTYNFDMYITEDEQLNLNIEYPHTFSMYNGKVKVTIQKTDEIPMDAILFTANAEKEAIIGKLIDVDNLNDSYQTLVQGFEDFTFKKGYYAQSKNLTYCKLRKIVTDTVTSKKNGKEYLKVEGIAQDNLGKVVNFGRFALKEEDFNKCKTLNSGDYVIIGGEWEHDDWSNQDKISVASMTRIDKYSEYLKNTDNSGRAGRFELNVSTKMSTNNSLNDAKQLANQASLFGLNGMAIVDDNSVQGVNDALMANSSKKDLKTLLGCELNIIDDENMDIFIGKEYHGSVLSLLKDNDFYVFDTETTGLSSIEDKVTQMSSVKMEHGLEVDTFDKYANPEKDIPRKVKELTHLENIDLNQYPTSEQVILDWAKNFIDIEHPENKILVAHNAKFDLSMIDPVLEKNGLPKLEEAFTIIDTLYLARFLLRSSRQHTLGVLAEKFELELDAHNAFNDTRATAILVYYLFLLTCSPCDSSTFNLFDFDSRSDYFGDSIALSSHLKSLESKSGFKSSLSKTDLSFFGGNSEYNAIEEDVQKLVKILNHSFETLNENGIANIPFGFASPISIIAKDLEGRKVLYKLITKAHTLRFYRTPRIWLSDLLKLDKESRSHILVGTGNDSSIVNDYVTRLGVKKTIDFINKVGFDYIEVCPPSCYYYDKELEDPVVEANKSIQVKRILNDFKQIESITKIPCVAVSESRYLLKEDSLAYNILHNQLSKGYVKPLYLRNPHELYNELCGYVDKETAHNWVYENTMKVGTWATPNLPLAPSKLNAPEMPNAKEELIELTHQGLKKFYGDNPPKMIVDRMNTELNLLIKNGYEVIYLLAHKIVKHANDKGYLVGSRGSVGSSLVALFCGITEINALPPHYRSINGNYTEFVDNKKYVSGFDLPPKKNPIDGTELIGDGHNIPFETFLGTDGTKIPDIDLNFEEKAQTEGHNYLRKLFGKNHTIRVGTVSCLQDKTSMAMINKYSAQHRVKMTIPQKEFLAEELTGIKRTTGQHPAGILIVPKDKEIEDFTPQQYPANKVSNDWKTSHLPMTTLHDCLLKMDVLGQDSPFMLRKLREATGVDPHEVKPNDPKIISLFTSAKELNLDEEEMLRPTGALALPEFGTDFVLQMLVETQPQNFSDLVQISGLSHGTNVWIGNAQDLIKDGRAKLSEVIASRDKLLTDLFNYGLSYEDANDIVYRVKKKKPLTEHLIQEMEEHNLPEWYLESIKKIKYMFPKGHATSYVQDAVRIAYYKLNYPFEFYATWLSIRDLGTVGVQPLTLSIDKLKSKIQERDKKATEDFTFGHKPLEIQKTRAMNVIYEARLRGIEFMKPDVNLSEASDWKVIKNNGEKKIIAPLSFIKGVGDKKAISIIEARNKEENHKFNDKEKFMTRFKSIAEILDKKGSINF